MKYHYLYKITNKSNGKIYVGIHTTKNLKDGYMGSGSELCNAYLKEGIDIFEKEILEFYSSRKLLAAAEEEIVNREFIEREDTYNIILGGDRINTTGFTSFFCNVTNESGVCSVEEFGRKKLSGEYRGVASGNKGLIRGRDANGNKVEITSDEYWLFKDTGKFDGISFFFSGKEGTLTAFDSLTNKHIRITVDKYMSDRDRYKSVTADSVRGTVVAIFSDGSPNRRVPCFEYEELKKQGLAAHGSTGNVPVRYTKTGLFAQISCEEYRILKELGEVETASHQNNLHKVMTNDGRMLDTQEFYDLKNKGLVAGVSSGKVIALDLETGKNISIDKETFDILKSEGKVAGAALGKRKGLIYIYKEDKRIQISSSEYEIYKSEGWMNHIEFTGKGKNRVCYRDLRDGSRSMIDKRDFQIGKEMGYFVGANSVKPNFDGSVPVRKPK